MPNRLFVNQIFLPQPKTGLNFVSVYEETIKNLPPVYLFFILEIRGEKKSPAAKKQTEFEKLTQALVRTLKQTYLGQDSFGEEIFEKALTNLNNTLSSLTTRGMTSWYKKLNAAVAVFTNKTLFLSTTGTTISAYLLRDQSFTQISENLSPASPHPLKTFVNFAAGTLNKDDFLILTTVNLFNYVSLEKLRQLFGKQTLDQTVRELVEILTKDVTSQEPFASFIAQVHPQTFLPEEELQPLLVPNRHTIIEDKETVSAAPGQKTLGILSKLFRGTGQILFWVIQWIWLMLKKLMRRKTSSLPARPGNPQYQTKAKNNKKTFLITFLVLLLIFLVNLVFLNFRNAQRKTQKETEGSLAEVSQNITDAEAALIYDDQNRALSKLNDAQANFTKLKNSKLFEEEVKKLDEKITKLSLQLNKIRVINQTEQLAQFTTTPNQLIKIPGGFLAFNSFTDALEHYEDGTVAAKTVPLTSSLAQNLVSGIFVPELNAAVFMSKNGIFYQLDLAAARLIPISSTSTAENTFDIVTNRYYGGRSYALERTGSQIFRAELFQNRFSAPAPWLNESVDLTSASDLAVDGNIYALLPDQVLKLTRGQKQEFSLPALSQPLRTAKRIVTDAAFQFLYIVDREHSRIVVLTKQGTLAVQLVSESFSEISDIWVDEKNKLMHVLAANKLLRFRY